jgi:hypothetical protein
VQRGDAGALDEDRVQHELRDLRDVLPEPGDPLQQLLEGSHVSRCPRGLARQQLVAADRPHQLRGVAVGERQRPRHRVDEQVDRHPAEAQREQRPG